jgi:hypothetical protein
MREISVWSRISNPNWWWIIMMIAIGVPCTVLIAITLIRSPVWVEGLIPLVIVFLPALWMAFFHICSIDVEGSGLRLNSIIGKSIIISASEIAGFSNLHLMNSSRRNVLLYMKDGRHIPLTGFLLATPDRVENHLKFLGIDHLGEESSIFFPMPKWRYKFDTK